MKRYSLANYTVSIEPNDSTLKSVFGTMTIGGQGSALDSISLSLEKDLWSTTGFATGGWAHDKNLSRIGSCTISIHQLSDAVIMLIRLCKVYYTGDYAGCTITVADAKGNQVANCIDCYPTKIQDQEFKESSDNQSWEFTCGQITY